jgi:hypothetical protein
MALKTRLKNIWTFLKKDLTSLHPGKILLDVTATLAFLPITARAILSYLAIAFSVPSLIPLLTPSAKTHLAPFNITTEMVDHLAPNKTIHVIDGRTWHGKVLAYFSSRPSYFGLIKGDVPNIFNSHIRAWASSSLNGQNCTIYFKENTYPDKNSLFKVIALHELAHCHEDNYFKSDLYQIEQDATIKALETIKKFSPKDYRRYYTDAVIAFDGAKDYDFSLSYETQSYQLGRFYTDAEIKRAFNEIKFTLKAYIHHAPLPPKLVAACAQDGFPPSLKSHFVPQKQLRRHSPEGQAMLEIGSKVAFANACDIILAHDKATSPPAKITQKI